MKTGLSLADFAAKLDRQKNAAKDYLVDTRELTVMTGGGRSELHLPEGVGERVLNQNAHRQIGGHLKVPVTYYDMIRESHPALLDHTISTLFRERPARRMVRTFDYGAGAPEGDPYVRAFLSSRYRRRDNYDLAQVALPILGELPDVHFPSMEVTESRMYITAVAPRVQGEVRKDDIVQAGVRISNSEVGHGSLKVQPIVFRLWCLNGCVSTEATRAFHVGREDDSAETLKVLSNETLALDDQAFFAKMGDVIKAAVDETQFNAILAQMREAATGEKIEKPIEAMERLQGRFDLTGGEKDSVLKHLIEGGDLTAYGALNAVTRAAQDAESYDRSMELEQVGGKLLDLAGTREWRELAAA